MKPESATYHRRSIRLKGYDYSSAGANFVTICTQNRECLFGQVVGEKIHISEIGAIVQAEWIRTPEIRNNVLIDEFIIMPNHLHGILFLREWDDVGAHCNVPLPDTPQTEQFGKSTVNSIPTIIKLFKSTVTKQINELRGTPGKPIWQRNYFERVIRDDEELNRIREYIIYNPLKWADDSPREIFLHLLQQHILNRNPISRGKDNPQNWK